MSTLKITGAVAQPREFTFAQLAELPAHYQIADVSRLDAKRQGDAVSLAGLAALAEADPAARYLGLHSTSDNFHASVPLAPILSRAFVIYRVNQQPLATSAGGPYRFFIPNHHACRTDEIDECANVKYVDEIEFTLHKGHDNRPHDEREHAELHEKEITKGPNA